MLDDTGNTSIRQLAAKLHQRLTAKDVLMYGCCGRSYWMLILCPMGLEK